MSADRNRPAAVAGRFYKADPEALTADVRSMLVTDQATRPYIAVVVPHAGLRYSGQVAGATYARTALPERVIVLAVNHRGFGVGVASWSAGAWMTPLGALAIDEGLTASVARHAPFVVDDPRAHSGEHSLEVQLPFLQLAVPSARSLVAISVATNDPARLEDLGHAVAAAILEAEGPVLIVASTDMTHYEEATVARAQDELALAKIREVDGPGLLATVREHRISMCGVAPTTAALVAARDLGASVGELVRYATSGDVTGDHQSVVGYAGLVIR